MKGLAGMVRERFSVELSKYGPLPEDEEEKRLVLETLSARAEKTVHDILCLVLIDIQDSFNVTNKMSETQIEESADIIREEFYFLTPADFQLFSKGAKSGKFGESFNRLDAQVICTMLRQYVEERLERAQYNSKKEHRQLKEAEKLSPEQIAAFKARFYNGADDLFQKIKANDEEPDESERKFQAWNRDRIANSIPIEEQIRLKEAELARLKQSVERGEGEK